jgi:rhodanese-related sulfurtransferase
MPNLNKNLRFLIIAVFLSLALFIGIKEPPYSNIENDQLQTMLENNVPIYDVRRPEEWYQTGVIEGSQLLTFVDANGRVQEHFLSRFTADVGKSDPVILICRTGIRTSTLARHLVEELGYTNVFNVDDGITQWLRENRPVHNIIKPTFEMQYIKGLI